MNSVDLHIPSAGLPADCRDAAAVLNRGCVCTSVDHEQLRHALQIESHASVSLLDSHPNLFSDTLVFVAEAHLQSMAELIATVERVVALSAWQERALAGASAVTCHDPKAASVFFGYDFHLGDSGPRLIEINTNAGGALLNTKLLQAQRACCSRAVGLRAEHLTVESDMVAMFRNEWRLARGDTPLERIAIVDEAPAQQFLSAEFDLFRHLFEAHGISARVVDSRELSFDGNNLLHEGWRIDLVYNRLTDFAFGMPQHSPLRDAYLADAVVLTPHPRAHALYADKRNLAALSDADWLTSIGVSAEDRQVLKERIPITKQVTPENAADFWQSRKQWFFKPAAGFGSRAAYRGDKITKRVFDDVGRGAYVAQALVPPSERRLLIDGVERDLKLDLRAYVYQGTIQLVSARLYQGQTTNFRTQGGGFASVFSVPCKKGQG